MPFGCGPIPGILSYAEASLISGSGKATSMSLRLAVMSRRGLRPLQKFSEVVVHASNAEIRFALEWAAEIVNPMRFLVLKLDDRQDEVLGFFSSRRRHTRFDCDWSSDVCSSD